MKKLALTAFYIITLVTPTLAAPPVEEIINRANLAAYYSGDDGRSEVSMTITDSQGRVRKRQFIILRKDIKDGGAQKFYVYFKKPGDIRKTVFLVHKYIDRDDDRWMYLPALDLVKRIAGSDKRTSFVGSHFFYEDVSGRSINEDRHELVEETDEFFILENRPVDPASVEFSSYRVWINKTNWLPIKAEYLDRQGIKYRVVEALTIKDVAGIPTVTSSRVQDLSRGGNTVTTFDKIT